jgi:predicted house-cleaning NTP pyrophosphatase (Maf/HAM1 superfamily)
MLNRSVNPSIYLASQSPRRAQLLELLGMPFELLLPGKEEDAEAIETVLKNEAPAAYVLCCARTRRWRWGARFTASLKMSVTRCGC